MRIISHPVNYAPPPHSPLPTPHSPLPTPHSPLPTPWERLPFEIDGDTNRLIEIADFDFSWRV